MKNKKLLFIGIIIALILLVPVKIYYKDWGSIGYKSILYEVTNYASLDGNKGIEIQILCIEVYSNVQKTPY